MTEEQALRNLDNAAAQLPASRETHAVLQQSVAMLRRCVELPKESSGCTASAAKDEENASASIE